MDTRRIASEYRLSHWAQVMRERLESGLSIKAYCERAGCHENVFYYWRRKLREAACTEFALPETKQRQNLVPTGWTQIEPSEPDRTHGALTIEVGEYRVAVDAGSDLDMLAKVCRMLKTL